MIERKSRYAETLVGEICWQCEDYVEVETWEDIGPFFRNNPDVHMYGYKCKNCGAVTISHVEPLDKEQTTH